MQVTGRLDVWFAARQENDFPAGNDYPASYKVLAAKMRPIHREVDRAALLAEITAGRRSVECVKFLTHHGQDHVEQVIRRVSDLLVASGCELDPYEAYLLLWAIHLHDAGNIYGRDTHTCECRRILSRLGDVAGTDTAEKKTIVEVAEAHSACGANEDTISILPSRTELFGRQVRPQFLAAILRLADEISDDQSRASCFLMDDGRLPSQSELFHQYSRSLNSVFVQQREITLRFIFPRAIALKEYAANGASAYLLDEVLGRTMKMHLERLYCSRFLRPNGVDIDRIAVVIEVIDDDVTDSFLKPIKCIHYRLEEKGYPLRPTKGIVEVCPDLAGMDGATLRKELE